MTAVYVKINLEKFNIENIQSDFFRRSKKFWFTYLYILLIQHAKLQFISAENVSLNDVKIEPKNNNNKKKTFYRLQIYFVQSIFNDGL